MSQYVLLHEILEEASTTSDTDQRTDAGLEKIQYISLQLPNGHSVKIALTKKPAAPRKESDAKDCLKAYGHLTLELGILFKNFLESINTPNRARMIRTLKVMMVILKSDNNLSKYADEILRFLLHQVCLLPEKQAHCMFYAMFVNTKGRVDSHIPVDLQMEFLVKNYKKTIKHMQSNKTMKNIERKTGVLASLNMLIENFDKTSDVTSRNGSHRRLSSIADEVSIFEDLRKVKPFYHQSGRQLEHFTDVPCSLLSKLRYEHFFSWMMRRKDFHAQSLGN